MVWQSNPRALFQLLFALFVLPLADTAYAQVVLLDFSSASCGPCQQMRPTVQRLAAAGYEIRHIDIGREPSLAAQHHVDVVPTFIALADGREIGRVQGICSYEQLANMLDAPSLKVRGQSPTSSFTPSVVPNGQQPTNRTYQDPIEGPSPVASNSFAGGQAPSTFASQPGQPSVSPSPGPASGGPGSLARNLIESTVKLSVDDPEGVSAGTGTVIDVKEGAALVLTCGHLFRSSAGKGQVTVTLYDASTGLAQKREDLPGQLLHYDLERDLALVIIRPRGPVVPRKLGIPGSQFTPGQGVTTVGCNHGDDPTVIQSQITSVNRYQGAPNLQVAGAPVEGRSGGGLFDSEGRLIGVCFAADPQANEGLYCSLPAIMQQLDELKLSMVYQESNPHTLANASSQAAPAVAQAATVDVRGQDSFPELDVTPTSAPMSSRAGLSSGELAALEEIQRRGTNSEVICIIRPLDPQGKSEVITLNSVSPQFVEALSQQNSTSNNQSPATAAAERLLTR